MTSREFRERLLILGRLEQVVVPSAIIEPLGAYLRLLSQWNARINLTSLPLQPPSDETFNRLLLEPLAAAAYVPDVTGPWFDIGSGGGSPAIPLKLARPALELRMVESKTRKAAFLREVTRTLGLSGVQVVCERLQNLASRPEMQAVAQLVTMRAVRTDVSFYRATRRLIAQDGQLLIFCSTEPQNAPPEFAREDTVVLGGSHKARLVRYTPVFHVEQTS